MLKSNIMIVKICRTLGNNSFKSDSICDSNGYYPEKIEFKFNNSPNEPGWAN